MHVTVESNMKSQGRLIRYSDTRLVKVWNETLSVQEIEKTNTFDKNKVIDLNNDRVKILIEGHQSPLHYLLGLYGNIVNGIEAFDNPIFVINTTKIKAPWCDQALVEFFYYFLKDNNIDYVCVDSTLHQDILVNNFYHAGPGDEIPVPNSINKIYEFMKKYIKNKDVTPNKKVYLSRKKTNPRLDRSFLPEGISIDRIDDEVVLEKFFKQHGFEIVYPEDFKSFEDQINYFNEVSVAVSMSGGGAINAIFMQPGGVVLELTTTLFTPSFDGFMEAHHQFFSNVAFKKDHTYVAIKNEDKKAATLIKKIKTNKLVMDKIIANI